MIITGEEKIGQETELKSIEKIKNYFIKEIEQNELMSKKNKNYIVVLKKKKKNAKKRISYNIK